MSQASKIYEEIQNRRDRLMRDWHEYISLSGLPGVGLESYTLELKQERDKQLREVQDQIVKMFADDGELLRLLPENPHKKGTK